MAEPRGAGRSGGLLFLAVCLFLLYLVIRVLAGVAKLVVGGALLVVLAALAVNVVRRR